MSKSLYRTLACVAGALALACTASSVAQILTGSSPSPVVRAEETIPLAEAFPENAVAREHTFRARQLVLAPGARTEIINHAGRPAITYVTQGVVREHRTGVAEPIVHNVGAATMDRGTVTHFWENAGPGEAVLLVVEVAPRQVQ